MELDRIAGVGRETVLAAQTIAFLGEERAIGSVGDGLDDTEVSVGRLGYLHSVVADDINRIVPHLAIYARGVACADHDALVVLFQTRERLVVERNVPAGYIMTVEERELSFVVTNTLDTSEPPIDPPDTGDTFNLLVPILLLGISGSALLLFGIAGKRNEQ